MKRQDRLQGPQGPDLTNAVFSLELPGPSGGISDSKRTVTELFSRRLGIFDFPYPKSDSGRPAAYQGFDWSVSHSAGAVFASAAPFCVGVDVEAVKARSESVWNALHPSFSVFRDGSDEGFYFAWTAAESVVKLTGEGVDAIPFLRLETSVEADVRFDRVEFCRISDIVGPMGRYRSYSGKIRRFVYSVAVRTDEKARF